MSGSLPRSRCTDLAPDSLAELHPAELRPAELRPAELHPAELHPAELHPAELRPAESHPAQLLCRRFGDPCTTRQATWGVPTTCEACMDCTSTQDVHQKERWHDCTSA